MCILLLLGRVSVDAYYLVDLYCCSGLLLSC